ncbi:hypothetical protein EN745_09665 [Mesorhizobium sp. M4A.F.Ca.ET.022.05.2.1]|uniref:hypothetical protein n=1 Tax=Mesorhizobium sp. M4A.F.Ca.ET.022.05.2.1 TaxID=2496653 RepID=UPI000FCCA164|nr:hypothetical protein [Mesorhizobium sp. M4A.F.Ca.ET.022.05.2.1]RVC81487.1 hypothetical protein EN745_09665 [Mesorhizobium sp. M4A.F.Ca.ET.022.05.2.1]
MKTEEEVEELEKLIGQLEGLHSEISQLAKKSPNDGLNVFKLKLVNRVLQSGNRCLTGRYKPFEDFDEFDESALPTNSDVTMILTLYMEQAERFRSDNVVFQKGQWFYQVGGAPSNIKGRNPTRVGGEKK